MARISQNSIAQIKNRADILDIVSDFVQLKRKGRNYFGLCPFHEEKTPSFSVNPAMNIFHCFGCGKGGSAITFLMEYEHIEYVEALKRLAERYHITLEWEGATDDSRKGDTGLLYELHELASDYYQKQLYSETGEQALAYLHERGFKDELLKEFSIGYAPAAWDALFNQVDKEKFGPRILEKSGLFLKKENNRFLDRFRNRIMFPIAAISERIVAFGGRSLDPDEDAKYMNSPETPIYFKSGTLYGLDRTRRDIQKTGEAILVEGYTDLLRFYGEGITNVVAGSGTALNYHHARALKRFSEKILLCYDGDDAGRKAAERAGFILLQEGLDVSIIRLPVEHDPDSFLRQEGPEAFAKLRQNAATFIADYLQNHAAEMATPAAKTRLIDGLIEELGNIRHPVNRDLMVKELAEALGVREERLFAQLGRYIRSRRSGRPAPEERGKPVRPVIQLRSATEKAEFELIKLLLLDSEDLRTLVRQNVAQRQYRHPVLKELAAIIYTTLKSAEDFEPAQLFEQELSEEGKFYLSRLLYEVEKLGDQVEAEDLQKLALDCMTVILSDDLEKRIRQLREAIKAAEKNKQEPLEMVRELAELQQKRQAIRKELREL